MKAFWWFREGAIAGMARPGFNSFRWFDLAFDEAILLGWIGQHSTGCVSLESFRAHLQTYAPRVFRFYQLDDVSGPRVLTVFESRQGLEDVLRRLTERTKSLATFSVQGDEIELEICQDRLAWEIRCMKDKGIDAVVTLTESHHGKDVLADHFDVHHIGIADLGAPTVEQVEELARFIQGARGKSQSIAVHCLAGIGRTSTMLIGAHMLLGESKEDLLDLVRQQNPAFVFTGAQAEFIHALDGSKKGSSGPRVTS